MKITLRRSTTTYQVLEVGDHGAGRTTVNHLPRREDRDAVKQPEHIGSRLGKIIKNQLNQLKTNYNEFQMTEMVSFDHVTTPTWWMVMRMVTP